MYYYTIGQYLEHILHELEKELKGKDSSVYPQEVPCECGNTPENCTRTQALLYYMKYHFGYAFEYEYIYTNHIIKSFCGDRMNVLSVGCGNGIDLWALCHALDKNDTDISVISYTGIEKRVCSEVFRGRKADRVRYRKKCGRYSGDTDVLFLPRSVGLMDRAELDTLTKRISCGNRLYIAASFRSGTEELGCDVSNFDYLIDCFERAGLHLKEGKRNKYFKYNEAQVCGIKSIYHDYEYPDRALTLLGRLREQGKGSWGLPVLTNSMLRYNYAVMES